MLSGECLIIRADASTEIGAGHLMRCLALTQAWQDAGGKVVFITACQSDGLLQRLRQEKVELYQLPGSYPDPVDWEHTRQVISAHPGAWVVLDGYHFDHTYQRQVKEAGHRLMVIDDLVHFQHYYADIVFNQNLHAEQLHYPAEPYTRLLLGTRYVLLRREFRTWKSRPREIPEVARLVLVTLSGSDPENYTLKVLQALQQVNVPDIEITAVIGASNPHNAALETAARQSRIHIRLVRDARNMPELMAWADAAISGGGGTYWELAYLGVPALVLAWAPNQEPNTRLLQERGAASAIILKDVRSPEMMTRLIGQLLSDRPARAAMSRMGQTIVDGNGAQRIIAVMSGRAETTVELDKRAA